MNGGAIPLTTGNQSAIPVTQGSTPQGNLQVTGAPATADQPQEQWWQKILPTAGGILGGIGGGALGTVLGGPVGGIAGGIAGAGLLGGAGKALEEGTSGQQLNAGDIAGSALENAGGQAIGGAIGGTVAKIGGKLLAPLAEKFAQSTLAGQAGKGLISPEVAQYLFKNHGITDLKQAGDIAKVVTGHADAPEGTALINKAVESGIAKNGPQRIDMSEFTPVTTKGRNAVVAQTEAATRGNQLEAYMTQNALTDTQKNAIRSNVNALMGAAPKSISGQTDAISALNFQRGLSGLANQAQSKYIQSGYQDVASSNLAKTYDQIAGDIKDKIFSPNGQDVVVPQAEKDQLSQALQKGVGGINQKSADSLSNEVQAANTYKDLRGVQAKWVQTSQALQTTADQAARSYGLTTNDLLTAGLPIASAIGGAPKGIIATAATAGAHALGQPATTSALSSIAKGAQGKVAQQILPTLIKATSVAGANLPNDVPQPSTTPINGASTMNPSMNMTPNPTGAPGTTPTNPYNTIYNDLLSQSVLLGGTPYGGNATAALASLAPQLQKNALAGSVISNLIPSYNAAGGAQGLGGGLLSQLSSLIPGSSANVYGNQSNAAASELATLLGISPEAAHGLIPSLMSTPQTAAPQAGILGGITSALPTAY